MTEGLRGDDLHSLIFSLKVNLWLTFFICRAIPVCTQNALNAL